MILCTKYADVLYMHLHLCGRLGLPNTCHTHCMDCQPSRRVGNRRPICGIQCVATCSVGNAAFFTPHAGCISAYMWHGVCLATMVSMLAAENDAPSHGPWHRAWTVHAVSDMQCPTAVTAAPLLVVRFDISQLDRAWVKTSGAVLLVLRQY
jgi:hypothetical protein